MTLDELRSKYLNFFVTRGHALLPSSPLVPENDPTTLFTSSGMQPLVPYLLGQPHPLGKRLVDSQKSFRSQDIEEVGDNRHTTFFEMLGNWSLGDYFKKEQLEFVYTFLTEELRIPKSKLAVTVFEGNDSVPKDEESIAMWKSLGIPEKRIFEYGVKKNWWSRSGTPDAMPAGEPGGPDSEIFFEFTDIAHDKAFGEDCHPNCDCGRFMEIGNSVFMQYQKNADGSLSELSQKNVDFGGGLERMLAAANNDPDVFKTNAFTSIVEEIEALTNKKYDSQYIKEIRVIADHLKAAVFLIKDGVRPSNKEQGYFLRRLIRRATVKLHKMGGGLNPGSLFTIADRGVLNIYDGVYFDRAVDRKLIDSVLVEEAEKFARSLDRGLKVFEKQEHVDGKMAFDLYQTYGFPLEITVELAEQKGQSINLEEFKAEFTKHKDLSRTSSAGMFKGGLADTGEITTKYHTATHLLQAALRKILGTHVGQKGSNITAERMRFDFSHPQALTEDEKKKVEDQMNLWISEDLPVTVRKMKKQEALTSGAIAFFVEKYPDDVTVYTIGKDDQKNWISKELCGGPHVTHTGEIGKIKITKEQAVAAGIRRIYVELSS